MSDAAGRLPRKTREQMPEVPWAELLEAREKLEGDGWKNDLDEIWRLVKKVVPRVVRDIPVAREATNPQMAFMSEPPPAPRRSTKGRARPRR